MDEIGASRVPGRRGGSAGRNGRHGLRDPRSHTQDERAASVKVARPRGRANSSTVPCRDGAHGLGQLRFLVILERLQGRRLARFGSRHTARRGRASLGRARERNMGCIGDRILGD